MGSNMPNVRVEFRRDGSTPVCHQTHNSRQSSSLKIYYLENSDYAKPFEFEFTVSHDLSKMLIRFYNPLEKQWHEKWVPRF